MRNINAYIASIVLKITGFRFSKDYRYGTSAFHRVVYKCVNTVKANQLAD